MQHAPTMPTTVRSGLRRSAARARSARTSPTRRGRRLRLPRQPRPIFSPLDVPPAETSNGTVAPGGNQDNSTSGGGPESEVTPRFETASCVPTSVQVGIPVTCRASGYVWTIEWSAPGAVTTSGQGSEFTTTYATTGVKTLTVRALSPGGTAQRTLSITVRAPVTAGPVTLSISCDLRHPRRGIDGLLRPGHRCDTRSRHLGRDWRYRDSAQRRNRVRLLYRTWQRANGCCHGGRARWAPTPHRRRSTSWNL